MKPASGRRPVPSRPQSIDRLKQAQNDYKNILLNAGDIVMDDNFKVNGLAGSPAVFKSQDIPFHSSRSHITKSPLLHVKSLLPMDHCELYDDAMTDEEKHNIIITLQDEVERLTVQLDGVVTSAQDILKEVNDLQERTQIEFSEKENQYQQQVTSLSDENKQLRDTIEKLTGHQSKEKENLLQAIHFIHRLHSRQKLITNGLLPHQKSLAASTNKVVSRRNSMIGTMDRRGSLTPGGTVSRRTSISTFQSPTHAAATTSSSSSTNDFTLAGSPTPDSTVAPHKGNPQNLTVKAFFK